ncbi:HMG box protein [Colletotrichum tofieldiae]|nr:HMG box protein [Colletotrichum tofieldiae]GKT75722.1 HMG box protein [Colletotrichum tofieldiae]
MLTAIGRAAAQRLFLRAAPLAGPRTQPIVRAACRDFSTSQWVRVPATKASSTTTKTKKTTEAKDGAATKKKATTKTKEAAAKKPKAKKKAVVKKPAPKKRVKKVLTPEEKQKLDVREWKKLALLPDPKQLPASAWLVHATESGKQAGSLTDLTNRTKESAESFKKLSSYELQRLQEKADENKLTNNATYKAWVESHTPQAVAEANRARAKLRKASGRKIPSAIRDDRQPKRPQTPFALFTKARWASGDFAGQRPSEAGRRIGNEWKALSEPEKGIYEELSKADVDRYARDALSVLGHVVQRRETPE